MQTMEAEACRFISALRFIAFKCANEKCVSISSLLICANKQSQNGRFTDAVLAHADVKMTL